MRSIRVYVAVAALMGALTPLAQAQPVSGEWAGDFAVAGVQGSVFALASHHQRLYASGYFFFEDYVSSNVAYVDPGTGAWVNVGEADGNVAALAVSADGHLYAGGSFTSIGGVAASNVARFDPIEGAWHPLSSGTDGSIEALYVRDDGTLYSGGAFSSAGGVGAQNLARWNAEHWEAVGDVEGARVAALTGSGDAIYVGGSFSGVGGVEARSVARLDLTTGEWSGLGGGLRGGPSPTVEALAVSPDGVFAGGWFREAADPDGSIILANNVARWDPNAAGWSALGGGTEPLVGALAVGPKGALYAGGEWGQAVVRRWDGAEWTSLDEGAVPVDTGRPVISLLATATTLYTGHAGYFSYEGENSNNFLYAYDLTQQAWHVVGNDLTNGLTDDALAVAAGPGGTAYAGGRFRFAGTRRADHVARWDGAAWHPLGDGTSDEVLALLRTADGLLYAGGIFAEVY